MTNQDLLDRGYGRYAPHKGQFNTDLFQKWVRIAGNRKRQYSIEVYRWQFPDGGISYEFEVHFREKFIESKPTVIETENQVIISPDGYEATVVITHSREASYPPSVIDELEDWYQYAYVKLGFVPDNQ